MQKGMKWLQTVMLSLAMLAGAVACTGEKVASGKSSPGIKTEQGKRVVSCGKDREKLIPAVIFATDDVVVENNSLSDKDRQPVKIFDINPLKPGVLDADGEPLKGGGGIAKGGKSKETQIWTETRKMESVANAYGHWKKHGKEFPEYQNAKQYVDATHTFVNNPPAGTFTATRKNGDTIYYNQSSNTFAVKNADGVPKTMFRPDPKDHGYPTNLDYFNAQK